MSRAERDKGARFERKVAAILRAHGLPIDRTARQSGIRVRGDLTGVPGYYWSLKDHVTLRMPLWIREADADALEGDVPLVVYNLRGRVRADLDADDLAKLLDLARLTA